MVHRPQVTNNAKSWRTLVQVVFGLVPITIMGFGVDPFMGMMREQWRLGLWQREAVYACVALFVISIVSAAWVAVDRRLFDGGSRGSVREGR